jgi:hypothetical protein
VHTHGNLRYSIRQDDGLSDCRTSAGATIDLIVRKGRRTLAFGLKSSTVPRVSKGFWNALDDISPDEVHVVAPVKESYPMKGDVMVSPLREVIATLQKKQR